MFKSLTLLLLSSALLFGQTGTNDKQALLAKINDKDTALTWVITGDSITHGAWFTKGARSYPEHLAERVRGELLRFRDIIINTGVSGDRNPRSGKQHLQTGAVSAALPGPIP